MPTNSLQTTLFDPWNEESWFFGFMSRDKATELLKKNETGAFLVRESTTAKGDLVLSVKESDDGKVSHYIINRSPSEKSQQVCFKIGEQIFVDIPSLLRYYKSNNLDDTPLKFPAVPKDPQSYKRSFSRDYLVEIQSDIKLARNTSQQLQENRTQLVPTMQIKLPGLAKVIQSRIPNAYDRTALTLKEGETVRVTKVDISGCWEGEIGGRKGHFPFNHVKFIEDPNNGE